MRYRIEMSSTRKGVARVHLPGRQLELAASQDGTLWHVAISDDAAILARGVVELPAASANDAVWRVARAAIRAIAELTGTPIDEELSLDPDPVRAP